MWALVFPPYHYHMQVTIYRETEQDHENVLEELYRFYDMPFDFTGLTKTAKNIRTGKAYYGYTYHSVSR